MSGRVVTKTVGKGITERTRRLRRYEVGQPDDDEAIAAAFERMAEASKDPWKRVAPIIDGARLELEELQRSSTSEADFREREGRGWYLRQLIGHGQLVQHHIENGDPAWAAFEALAFGMLISEMGIDHDWGADAVSGRASRQGAESTRKGKQEDRVTAVDALIDPTNPDRIGVMAAFAVVAEREGVHHKTIETDYYKAKKKASQSRD